MIRRQKIWLTVPIPLEERGHVKKYALEPNGKITVYFFNNNDAFTTKAYYRKRSLLNMDDIRGRYASFALD